MPENQLRRRRQLPVLGTADTAQPAPVEATGGAAVRIGLLTLGCDKNTVDSERILARLAGAGATVCADVADADVVVVNTCGFIDVAKEESIDAILQAVRLKQQGRVRAVVAMGCLVQRYKEELEKEIPEVDLFLGLTETERLVPALRARGALPAAAPVSTMERPLRLLTTRTAHTSYLKVSEGCDHTCAFCAIPLMRGKHRSTPMDVLVREARELEAQGVVELNLISQDTTWYGRDLQRGASGAVGDYFVGRAFGGMAGPHGPPEARSSAPVAGERRGLLPDLLVSLVEATSIPWLRLFYMYPSGIQPELVELMAREPRLLPYLDMPIQHGHDAVLHRMRRPERRATILERVGWLRAAVPDLALRTTVIVGFPGESDEEFEGLLELLEEVRFDRVGAFAYSLEEGTRAATLPGQVADDVKRERLERLLDLQRTITLERNERWVGRETELLVDQVIEPASESAGALRSLVGRTRAQAVEVDGVVHVAEARGARPGERVRVRITEALEDDLIGELLEN